VTRTVRTQRYCRYAFLCPIKSAVSFLTQPPPPHLPNKCIFLKQEEIQLLHFHDHQFIRLNSMKSAERKDRRSQPNLYQFYCWIHVAGLVKSHRANQNTSVYLSGLVTAVAVFRNPNTIPFCLTTDLLLNVLFSWLLLHLPTTFKIHKERIYEQPITMT
jgi:hypothetical protein